MILVKTPSTPTNSTGMPSARAALAPSWAVMAMAFPVQRVRAALAPRAICEIRFVIFFILIYDYSTCGENGKEKSPIGGRL